MIKRLFNSRSKFVRVWNTFGIAVIFCITFFMFKNSSANAAEANPTATPPEYRQKAPLDFNGDGKTDYVVVRSANNNSPSFWFINNGNTQDARSGQQWGQGVSTNAGSPLNVGGVSDMAVPADYDGDGKTDIAVWRPGARAYFYILESATNTFRAEAFGQTGDDPAVVGDYDGDGKADLAVYRFAERINYGSTGQNFFYYRPSDTPGVNFRAQAWGAALYTNGMFGSYSGDIPYSADYDGDGKADFIIQRAAYSGAPTVYFILKSSGGFEIVYWGTADDETVPGDYDGDGRTDICVRRLRNTSGAFGYSYYIRYANGGTQTFFFGTENDIAAPGDYDGDGRTDIALYSIRRGLWSVLPTTGAAPFFFYWGQPFNNFNDPTDVPPASFAVRPPFRVIG